MFDYIGMLELVDYMQLALWFILVIFISLEKTKFKYVLMVMLFLSMTMTSILIVSQSIHLAVIKEVCDIPLTDQDKDYILYANENLIKEIK